MVRLHQAAHPHRVSGVVAVVGVDQEADARAHGLADDADALDVPGERQETDLDLQISLL